MASNNTVTLIGNLGKAPEAFASQKGKYLILDVATIDSYKDNRLGAYVQKKPVWHTVFAFGPKVQDHALNFNTGDRIKVTATLSYRKKTLSTDAQTGKTLTVNEAILTAKRIEAAPLKRRKQPKDAA